MARKNNEPEPKAAHWTALALASALRELDPDTAAILRIVHDDGVLECDDFALVPERHDPGRCPSCNHHPSPTVRLVLKGSC